MICKQCNLNKPKNSFSSYKSIKNKIYLRRKCKLCINTKSRNWKQNSIVYKEWVENNKLKLKQYNTEYKKQWRKDNLEKHRTNVKTSYIRYRKNNLKEARSKRREYARLWKINNLNRFKEISNLSCRKYRELKNGLDWMYSKSDETITKLVFESCVNCGNTKNLQIDHHYPLSLGFGLELLNATLLCKSCNASKGNKLPEDFYTKEILNLIEYKFGLLEASCSNS